MTSQLTISGELADHIEGIANRSGITPLALLEKVVRQYVSRHKILHLGGSERRAYLRLSVRIPAIVYIKNPGGEVRYQSSVIRDVSPEGLKLVCTGRRMSECDLDKCMPGVFFELIFAYSDDMTPIRCKCEARRIECVDNEVHMGARIVAADEEGANAYRTFLSNLGLLDEVDEGDDE